MRVLKLLAIATIAFATVSCASNRQQAEVTRAPQPSATTAPSHTPTPVEVATPADPHAFVEQQASSRCDAQGTAAYPLGFVPQRESTAAQGNWTDDTYQLSYAAMVTTPAASPELPPVQKLVQVRCTLKYDSKLVVTAWSAN